MKKAIKIFGILFLLIIICAVALPFMFKDKIVQKAKDEANNTLNAKVDWSSFDLTLISSFPNFTFVLNDFKLIGINDFKNDTLMSLKTMELKLDLMSVIKGSKIDIQGIVLNSPRISAIVLKDGRANWDITKPVNERPADKQTEPSKFKIGLKKFKITNGYVKYDDQKGNMFALIQNLNHDLGGDFTQDIFQIISNTSMDALTYKMGGVAYLNKAKLSIKADVDANMPEFKFTFKENEFNLNALSFGLDGFVAMQKDDIDMDIKFDSKKAAFKEFLSLVPGTYTKDFANLKTSGKLAFEGYAKGKKTAKTLPAFGLKLLVENAMFQYPSLPKSVNNINIDLKVDNKTGAPDNTVIDLKKFHIEMAGNPFDLRMLVTTPVSDANIDGEAKGKLNFSTIKDLVPMEGTDLTGVFTADVKMKGRMSYIDKKEYDKFNAAGTMKIENCIYKSKDLSYVTNIKLAEMAFTPAFLDLKSFDMIVGKSDMQMVGRVDNYMAYVFKNEMLKGDFKFNSNNFNVTELMGPEQPANTAVADTTPMSIVEVPSNLDVVLTSTVKHIFYDKLDIYNASGTVKIKDSKIDMSDFKMSMLDGTMTMNGSYDTKNIKRPNSDFNMEINSFDIPKTFAYFNTVQKLAPSAKYAKGKMSSTLAIKTALDNKMMPDYASLQGSGKLMTKDVVLENLPSLTKVAELLKMDQFKKFALNNVSIGFKIKDGKVEVEPFDVKLGKATTTIAGVNYLDQRIDYKMAFQIPRSEMGGAANSAIDGLVAQAAGSGVNVNFGEMIKVNAYVTGTATAPIVKLDMKDQAKNMMNDLKDQVTAKAKEEFDKLKNEAETKAKAEIDRLKNEGEAKLKEEGDKIKAEADAKKREIEQKAKEEADKQKKDIEKKAKDKIKGLFGGG